MLTTLLVIAGVLVGLVALLALIVSLSARPTPRPGGDRAAAGSRSSGVWSAAAGPASAELPAAR